MMPPWLMSGRATAMEERIVITNLGHLWTPRDVATITHFFFFSVLTDGKTD